MNGGAWWAAIHGVAKSQKRLHFHFSLSCIGEGNGNPLQCSCLENPRDGGGWWAAVYGVAQSRTRLKQLSSSSSSSSRDVMYNMRNIINTLWCSAASVISDSATLWATACQAPLSMGFSRQEYWSRWRFPSPGDLPDPGLKPTSLMSPALSGEFVTSSITAVCYKGKLLRV